jgi:hypothetical protein
MQQRQQFGRVGAAGKDGQQLIRAGAGASSGVAVAMRECKSMSVYSRSAIHDTQRRVWAAAGSMIVGWTCRAKFMAFPPGIQR